MFTLELWQRGGILPEVDGKRKVGEVLECMCEYRLILIMADLC